jgi:2-keto-4-pentenoate hydratase/2-oxohepta-3-ene-1,7-dioic acid hydratase in catechol pathway
MYQANAVKAFPKIVCIGKNYLKHVIEMGVTEIPTTPVVFFKPWTSLAYTPTKLHLVHSKNHKIDHEL